MDGAALTGCKMEVFFWDLGSEVFWRIRYKYIGMTTWLSVN